MPQIQPDVSQMTDFEASKPDTYQGLIILTEIHNGKEKGTPGIFVTLKFTAPRLSDNEVREITRRTWMATAGKGTFTFDQILRCIGLADEADKIKAGKGQYAFDTDKMLNREVRFPLTNQVFNEKLQDNIQSFLPPQ